MRNLKVLSLVIMAGILNACAPQQSQELSSLTCAVGENCTNVDLDTALEKNEHDESEGSASADALIIQWQESVKAPELRNKSQQQANLPAGYEHLDPKNIVPKRALSLAVDFFNKYKLKFKNQKAIGVIDFSQKSINKRFYIVDLKTGLVEQILVSHGKNSDSNHDGYATKFSNIEGSLMSSLGAYMSAETYQGKHGLSLRLDGLESSNSLARKRAIVMHSADYVNSSARPLGRSYGCPAIENGNRDRMISLFKGGALLYAFYNQ